MESNQKTTQSIVNLCQHDIKLYDKSTQQLIEIFPPSGTICRCIESPVPGEEEEEAKIFHRGVQLPAKWAPSFSIVLGLPIDSNFTGSISPDILVSMPVGEILRKYKNMYKGAVYGPDTGPEGGFRDEKGNIIGTFNLLIYKNRTEDD